MKNTVAKTVRTGLYIIGGTVLLTENACAYVDPATTSYVVQIVAGIVIACGTGIGIFWNRMRRKLKKKKQDGSEAPELTAERASKGGVMTAEDLLDDDGNEEQK